MTGNRRVRPWHLAAWVLISLASWVIIAVVVWVMFR